ncbi:hypothetical protein J437_LFUL008081 [Ladona fulva]|uniref:Cytochrome b5 heme-binding domain-containing protein n=1 Tax=Ladona fulva TaxID=123851 RepID=A0A8K0KD68_LADFU|nr:hypothetical protein J437_LFUL008081 [Ladona fulva]
MAGTSSSTESEDLISSLSNPISVILIGIICFLVYKIIKNRRRVPESEPVEPELPKLRKDFTVEELRKYDGNGPDGRILVAVNGKVFDVTRGKRFYGPKGPYSAFAGRDASRGLATFSVGGKDEYDDLSDLSPVEMDSIREWEMQFTEGPYSAFAGRDASRGLATFSVGGKDEYDDLSDLSPVEMDSIREWEMQFTEKYTFVGRLLKPGEEATNYSDEEEESVQNESPTEGKKDQ